LKKKNIIERNSITFNSWTKYLFPT